MNSNTSKKIIMHIDVNSAFLSWQAAYELQKGSVVDLRSIPSVVGGSTEDRKGIVLAKSISAKSYGIVTGEPLWKSRQKCPDLLVVPPNYQLYKKCSKALGELLQRYIPNIQRFSIDEFFVDYTGMEKDYGCPVSMAYKIKDKIKNELGFTVNVGIGNNKLTAKMAGELKKPDMVHTLWSDEIKNKLWPLPVRELYMVGKQTEKKLKELNIYTIGELAIADDKLLKIKFKSYANLIRSYANGIESHEVQRDSKIPAKGIGNSSTIKFDVEDKDTAYKILLSLTETVALRMRASNYYCNVVSVSLRTSELQNYSHQRKLFSPTNITNDIFTTVKELFNDCWGGEKIRQFGVRASVVKTDGCEQLSIFDAQDKEKQNKLDQIVDSIREKYGKTSIMRGVFADSVHKPLLGGTGDIEDKETKQ
ncbi:MAG: DNA polymerase IV [Alkaliphilus sp.]